jgi:hypothetical protein
MNTGGLYYYLMIEYLMIEMIQVDMENTILTTKLANMNIAALEGENVTQACSFIQGIHNCLKLMGKVPHDVLDKLILVFQTTSVDRFNQLVTTLSYNKDLGLIDRSLLTVGKVVQLVERKYQDRLVKGGWTGAGNAGSLFVVQEQKGRFHTPQAKLGANPCNTHGLDTTNVYEGKTCWNCGGKDHI